MAWAVRPPAGLCPSSGLPWGGPDGPGPSPLRGESWGVRPLGAVFCPYVMAVGVGVFMGWWLRG